MQIRSVTQWDRLHLAAVETNITGMVEVNNPTVTNYDGHLYKISDVDVEEPADYHGDGDAWKAINNGHLKQVEWNRIGLESRHRAKQNYVVVTVGWRFKQIIQTIDRWALNNGILSGWLESDGLYNYMHVDQVKAWKEESADLIMSWVKGRLESQHAKKYRGDVVFLAQTEEMLVALRWLTDRVTEKRHEVYVLMYAICQEMAKAASRRAGSIFSIVETEFPDRAESFFNEGAVVGHSLFD